MSYQLEQARVEYQQLQDKYDELADVFEKAVRAAGLEALERAAERIELDDDWGHAKYFAAMVRALKETD